MRLDINIHKNILIQILKDIYSDDVLGPSLGFKGGTAAYMFYDLNRFSIDLDFDLLNDNNMDEIYFRVEKILKCYGKIKDSKKKKFTIFFLLSYQEDAQNIKIEINLRKFGSKYEVLGYFGISMKVMIKEDMFANKLVALFERIGKTNRDIFDVWSFLKKNWQINYDIISKRTNLSVSEFFGNLISRIEKLSNKNVLFGIGELLNKDQKDWARKNLIDDTIFLLKLRSDEIMQELKLTEKQRDK
jgi:predicted nucleotidyltransferase component of viral defense system